MQIERKHEKVIQSLNDAIYICDAAGYLKLFNKAAAELWGRQPEIDKDLYCGSYKILNKDGTDLLPEKHPLAIAISESKALDNVELIIKRPDGSYRNILHSSAPIFNADGKLAGAVTMLTDVTENAG